MKGAKEVRGGREEYPHVLAVRGPHGRFEHLLADGTVKIILAEARLRRCGSLGHGNTSGPFRADRRLGASPALVSRAPLRYASAAPGSSGRKALGVR